MTSIPQLANNNLRSTSHLAVPATPCKNVHRMESLLDQFKFNSKVVKVDDELGLVIGYAMICAENGVPYFDLQGDNIPESVMLKSALDFMENSRVAREMHGQTPEGQRKEAGAVVFAFPLTADIAKALDIEVKTTGLLIAVKPDAAMLAKFKSGEFTGFSIGGSCTREELTDAA